jgi:hypothetical protein
MTALDPALCARLVSEAREDDRRMTPAPWIAEADVLYHHSEEDGTIELAKFSGEATVDEDSAIARTRNNLRDLADQLEAALDYNQRLEAECLLLRETSAAAINSAADAVNASLRLEREVALMRDVVDAAVEGRADDLRIAIDLYRSTKP